MNLKNWKIKEDDDKNLIFIFKKYNKDTTNTKKLENLENLEILKKKKYEEIVIKTIKPPTKSKPKKHKHTCGCTIS